MSPALIALFAQAAAVMEPARRAEALRQIQEHIGAQEIMFFVEDTEVGALLPAPGFRQTLTEMVRWKAFLEQLTSTEPAWTELRLAAGGDAVRALGVKGNDGSVLVMLGGEPRVDLAAAMQRILPIMAAGLRGERAALAAQGHARLAQDAAGQAKLLALSLEKARRALQTALGQAEAGNRAKDEFLAVLSHELRTPLAPVLTMATYLLADEGLPEAVRDGLEVIRRNAELEVRLIDDLLDLTRVTKGKMPLHIQMVDIHRLVEQTVDICRSDIYRKKLKMGVELAAETHTVKADPARLAQVLWNLVKNAVKFTPEGGKLWITTENRQEYLVVTISDTGIGIEKRFLEKIFDAFEQTSDGVTHRFGGLGLGLAISKRLIEAQGGTIEARSEGVGKGATFSVTLAVAHVAASRLPTAAPIENGPVAGGALRVLLVEDHRDTAIVMSRLLKSIGHDVTLAGTMAAALEAAEREPIDVVLSDLGLPDGSGLDLMRQLAAQFGLPGVAISGYGMEDDVKRAHEAGFMAHLTKPINFQQLQSVLNQLPMERAMPR